MPNNFNPSVLIWPLGKVGRNVGIGECWDLANGALTVLEQNHIGNKEAVKSTAIRWNSAATKTTVTKKMKWHQGHKKSELATITVTVDVTVTGTLKAFRPMAKD